MPKNLKADVGCTTSCCYKVFQRSDSSLLPHSATVVAVCCNSGSTVTDSFQNNESLALEKASPLVCSPSGLKKIVELRRFRRQTLHHKPLQEYISSFCILGKRKHRMQKIADGTCGPMYVNQWRSTAQIREVTIAVTTSQHNSTFRWCAQPVTPT